MTFIRKNAAGLETIIQFVQTITLEHSCLLIYHFCTVVGSMWHHVHAIIDNIAAIQHTESQLYCKKFRYRVIQHTEAMQLSNSRTIALIWALMWYACGHKCMHDITGKVQHRLNYTIVTTIVSRIYITYFAVWEERLTIQ